MKTRVSWARCLSVSAAVLIASLFFSTCEYAIPIDANKRLVRQIDTPKALTIIRAGLISTNHQAGCDQYAFFHPVGSGWRYDIGAPEQISMTGNVVQFSVSLKDQRDNTPLASTPIEVDADLTKIDHIIEWTEPGGDTARDGYLIEIDFDKGYEEIPERGLAHPGARLMTQHTLYCGIAKENVGTFPRGYSLSESWRIFYLCPIAARNMQRP